METDGDNSRKEFLSEAEQSTSSRSSANIGESMSGTESETAGTGSVNIRSLNSSATANSTTGSCPTNSFLLSGRASSPNPVLHRPTRACPSPISSIVGTALNQLNLKRSSSAPMINQLGTGRDEPNAQGMTSGTSTAVLPSAGSGLGGAAKDTTEIDAGSLANSFLSSLSGSRPRRFSASFSPGSPGPAPSRVNQLRHEDHADWETASEKDFNGTSNIAQSWEDLSLDSMSMEVTTRRPSLSDQLWLSMPPTSSASSSPAASPRVLSRFSPSLSSPSPTRKSFTTRRSLSPIAVRPSVLSGGHGVKRKCDWDSNMMDCSPQPAKRPGGLLSFPMGSPQPMPAIAQTSVPSTCYQPTPSYNFTTSTVVPNSHTFFTTSQPNHPASPFNQNSSTSSGSLVSMVTNHVDDSQNSNETESSVSSNGGRESPFFRPVDSPLHNATSPEDSPHPALPKM
ncbi:unnamed protein product [Orchesella dallaii]|uniref:Uncharacterized protein n=1 Tax=Orchesella dallaii TaxID=48710 RepID=A0ABP1Q9P2_9HEXA